MRSFDNIVVALAGVLYGAATAFAGDMAATCPSVLKEESLRPGTGIAGWQTIPMQQHLVGAGMMDGAPETESYRMPDKESKGRQTFEFAKGEGQRWLWCLYGGMRLAKRLDDNAVTCTITTTTKKPENTVMSAVACK
jgi:hypothetical protein